MGEPMTVAEFVAEYEFRGDTDYWPNDGERLLIEDAIHGFLAQREEALSAAPTSPPGEVREEIANVIYRALIPISERAYQAHEEPNPTDLLPVADAVLAALSNKDPDHG